MNGKLFALAMVLLICGWIFADEGIEIKPHRTDTVNELDRWEKVFSVIIKGTATKDKTSVTINCPKDKPLTYYPWGKNRPYEVIKKEGTTFDLKPDESKKTFTLTAQTEINGKEHKETAEIVVTNAPPILNVELKQENAAFAKKSNPTERNYLLDSPILGKAQKPFDIYMATISYTDIEGGSPQKLPKEIAVTTYAVDSKGKAEDITYKKPFAFVIEPKSMTGKNERKKIFFLIAKTIEFDSKYHEGEYFFKVVFSLKDFLAITDETGQKAKIAKEFPKEVTANLLPRDNFYKQSAQAKNKKK